MTINATKEKPSKKRLVKVAARVGTSAPGGGYGYTAINFAFVSSPTDGRRQATSTMTCREYVNRAAWAAANKEFVGQHTPGEDAPIDFDRLRLLVVHDPSGVDAFKNKLFNGKAALNLLEKFNNWKPSTITTVNHAHYKNAWLLTGPKEWMAHPQMLSLATWVLRLSASAGPLDVKSFGSYENNLQKLSTKRDTIADISTYCNRFWNKLYVLMKYYTEIFGKMDHKDAWVKVRSPSFGVYSGLLNFVEGNAHYSDAIESAYSRYKKLAGQHLPRKRG